MADMYSEEEVIQRVFDANKQRGKYLAFIVKELDQAGFKDFDGAHFAVWRNASRAMAQGRAIQPCHRFS